MRSLIRKLIILLLFLLSCSTASTQHKSSTVNPAGSPALEQNLKIAVHNDLTNSAFFKELFIDFKTQFPAVFSSGALGTNSAKTAQAHLLISPGQDFPGKRRIYSLPVARVLCTAPGSPLYHLSKKEARLLLKGKITHTSQLTWSLQSKNEYRGKIRTLALRGSIPGGISNIRYFEDPQKLIQAVHEDRGAVGIINQYSINRKVRPLPVAGLFPSPRAIDKELYPLIQKIYFHIPAQKQELLASILFLDYLKKRLFAGRITFLAGGDVIPARGVGNIMKRWGWFHPFKNFLHLFLESELTFINLESAISYRGKKPNQKYFFRTNPAILPVFRLLKFDIVSVANNHSLDYGHIALQDTIRYLKRYGTQIAGYGKNARSAARPVALHKKGQRFSFLAYNKVGAGASKATATRAGLAYPDLPSLKQEIRAAKEKDTMVIVSVHAGTEYKPFPDRGTRTVARRAIDHGADLVIGHHPHWFQGTEIYKGKFILYSLGNFIFDQVWSEETKIGYLADMIIQDGQVKAVFPIPVYNKNYRFIIMTGKKRLVFFKKFLLRSRITY